MESFKFFLKMSNLLDFSDEELNKVVKEVQSKDEGAKRWVIFGFEAGTALKGIKVEVFESGDEYEDLCEELFQATTEVYWGYCRFKMGDFYRWSLFSYVGVGCKKIHCGKMPVYQGEVEKGFLKNLYHIKVNNAKEELIEDEEKILEKVKRGSSLYFD